MKHITLVTKRNPRQADDWQDFVCIFANLLKTLLGSFGGASPLIQWIDGKCDLPDPNAE
ncbi:MAG: hypothetical protein GWP08_07735 [Nitrospiraceae bacterium]|nr:hypothetical protein [Nitrospiraceae bacterium]